ncbi:uncharacterized protein OCT59_026920 [Rhizophagus irregularis]|uniref:uncharacterized protein n=1 Tax=Rhizophagus irregularis TaxID=588596 RepID=UPI000CAABBFB|nr:hypothetical protein OCT59_026920 [Rhizophagus irregularis]
MELVKLNDENSFDPTPKLKSSPVPIFFISFNEYDNNCIHCGEEYTKTIFSDQKYCKKCLSSYLTNITDNNIYLDVYLFTKDLECIEHRINKIKIPQNFQECCRNCLIVLYFKQISIKYVDGFNIVDSYNLYEYVIESEKYCKLCEKLLYQGTEGTGYFNKFKLCSTCYIISSGCIESTLTKKVISIIYLPWWENKSYCYCEETLVFTSNCQKYCENCFIFFIGCRYCLTTNIIFGITNQSQCKKCKRVSIIILDNKKIISINSGNNVLDDFLISIRHDQLKIAKFANDLKNIDKYFVPSKICDDSLCGKVLSKKLMKYIPYSQFTNVKKIAEGGFSIIYRATWLDDSKKNKIVILKRFKNLQYAKKYFLKELESNHRCYKFGSYVNETFGFTKGPKLDDYILVMQYASEGDLHKYLQKKFTEINWERKISFLYDILLGLKNLHDSNFIHRDFHSGNILVNILNSYYDTTSISYRIGDLGLSRSANDTSSDDEIYGVIPYIAPEIFKGSAFSKESDIYSLGMIMWELTTGCKPFANVEHDHCLIFNIIDGVRPEITEDTPECFANLMKSCWDSDPKKRPSIGDIESICYNWLYQYTNNQFYQAELKRKILIDSKKLGSKFSEKPHPKAIYTSRSLNSYISKCSSINFSSNDYISNDLEFDIDIKSSEFNVIGTKRNIEELNINSYENSNEKRIKTSSS